MSEEIVIVTTARHAEQRKVYHTEVCRAVVRANDWFPKKKNVIDQDRELCRYCSDESIFSNDEDRLVGLSVRGEVYCRDCWTELANSESGLCGFCRSAELVFGHPRDEPVRAEDRLV